MKDEKRKRELKREREISKVQISSNRIFADILFLS